MASLFRSCERDFVSSRCEGSFSARFFLSVGQRKLYETFAVAHTFSLLTC
jgi:hypothetical protein